MEGRLPDFVTRDEAATATLAAALAPHLADGDVLSLSGDLGAGKTTFVKALARALGVKGPVTSPTFNILVVHTGPLPLNHFDLYRLERERELEDIDYWGVMESGGVSVVEWGDRFPAALPPDHLSVQIEIGDALERTFELRSQGPRARALADAWRSAVRAGGDEA